MAEQRERFSVPEEQQAEAPDLDADEERLLANFFAASRCRPQAFEGTNPVALNDLIALYDAERWWEGDFTLMDYLGIMLDLDAALRSFYKERAPAQHGDAR